MRFFYKYIFYTITMLILLVSPIFAQYDENNTDDTSTVSANNGFPQKTAQHIVRDDISNNELLCTISFIYAVQWTYYVIAQYETISQHGSFENWRTNPFRPHFDNDSFDYNLVLHTMTGQYYYLFYRSRGFSKEKTLMASTISHLLFEFTIETVTERPSIQDMYQTPILGTISGVFVEYASYKLLSSQNSAANALGYLLNPFAYFSFSSVKFSACPYYYSGHGGYTVSIRY